MQTHAQEALESGLKEIERRQKYPVSETASTLEGALICFDLETGYLKALVGGEILEEVNSIEQFRPGGRPGQLLSPLFMHRRSIEVTPLPP